MAKYSGNIGFAITEESAPGVWTEQIVERHYYGDVTRNRTQIQTNTSVNGNITFSNVISILADPFAILNFLLLRFLYNHS